MITVQFYMNDKDLAAFFENAGYKTKIIVLEDYVPAYHNKMRSIQIDVLHVVTDNGVRPAKEVYQEIMRRRMVTPDPTTIAIANEILNND